jgi:hypothetical protein
MYRQKRLFWNFQIQKKCRILYYFASHQLYTVRFVNTYQPGHVSSDNWTSTGQRDREALLPGGV